MHFKYFSKVFAFEIFKRQVFAFKKNIQVLFKYIFQIQFIVQVKEFAAVSFFLQNI